MKKLCVLVVCIIGFGLVLHAQSTREIFLWDVAQNKRTTIPKNENFHKLIVFLSPHCPMCKSYTKLLREFSEEYDRQLVIYGVFSGKGDADEDILTFKEKYRLKFDLLRDAEFQLTHLYQATVTPEVVLLNKQNKVVYQGAIDNWLEGLGKQRIRATKTYLKDALAESLINLPVHLARTEAQGCIINDY